MSEHEEVLKLVEQAQSQTKFNLADVIKGRGFPEDTVDIYLDAESAYELSKLNEEIIELADGEDSSVLDEQAGELAKKIIASKLTFHMRGISQGLIEAIEKKSKVNKSDDQESFILEYFSRLIAATIVRVVDAAENVDDHTFTLEDIVELRNSLPSESWEQLVATTQKLTLASGYFRGLTDAGFLPKS